ncbi:MAG: hypothetical protein JWN07_2211 [Hyphomicrobiales bacterium]|nr:hypothetical protein [Hyphomicrobiales bacterium]
MADPVRRLHLVAEPGLDAKSIYEPDAVAVMVEALDASWLALAFAHFDDEQEMLATREVLAKRILQRVAAGERRVPVLSGDALGALEPRAAKSPGGQSWRVTRYAS